MRPRSKSWLKLAASILAPQTTSPTRFPLRRFRNGDITPAITAPTAGSTASFASCCKITIPEQISSSVTVTMSSTYAAHNACPRGKAIGGARLSAIVSTLSSVIGHRAAKLRDMLSAPAGSTP